MDDDDIDWGIKMLLQENRDLKFKFASLESQLATRNALVERLVEAGTMVLAYSLPMNETGAKWRMAWQPLVAKYRAMKKESVE